MYCLGKHLHHRCRERVCFRCSEVGHIAQVSGWIDLGMFGGVGEVSSMWKKGPYRCLLWISAVSRL